MYKYSFNYHRMETVRTAVIVKYYQTNTLDCYTVNQNLIIIPYKLQGTDFHTFCISKANICYIDNTFQ